MLASILELIAAANREEALGPDEIPEFEFEEWVEGTEHLAKKTVADLHGMLGLVEPVVPRFNVKDNTSSFDTWSEKGQEVLERPDTPALRMFWHQWAGLVKIVTNLMHYRNLLLMDGVGVGKTMQATAAIAMYDFIRLQQTQKQLPPALGKLSIPLRAHAD